MKVDMSAKAVTARLQRVSQMRDLALALGKAKPARPAVNEQKATEQKTAAAEKQ